MEKMGFLVSTSAVKKKSEIRCNNNSSGGCSSKFSALTLYTSRHVRVFSSRDTFIVISCCASRLRVRGVMICPGDYETIVGWTDRGISAFIRSCITYDPVNGQFQVHQAGLYVISIHLAFTGPISNVYAQRLMRCGTSFDEPILVDFQLGVTRNATSNSSPVHNSVVAGVAILRENQLLCVQAKPVERLFRGNGHSYISLFKLPGE